MGDLDDPPPRVGIGLVSLNMMSSLLAVARTAPASEDSVQLGGVKRPSVLTFRIAREPAQTSGAVEEPGRRQAATTLLASRPRETPLVVAPGRPRMTCTVSTVRKNYVIAASVFSP